MSECYEGTFVLVHWTKDSTSVVPMQDLVIPDNAVAKIIRNCTVQRYANCPAKVAGIGKYSIIVV